MELHPDCAPLAFLLGTWKGSGSGEYPTIEPFSYNEESTFGHVGKPFVAYTQKTRDAVTGLPLHAETGYLRAGPAGRIELVLVQPSGIIELHSGVVDGTVLNLTLDAVHTTATAKSVTDVVREIRVDPNGVLTYTVSMAAVGQPLIHHLAGELHRQPV